MMSLKCPLCKDSKVLPIDKKNVFEHLIITKDKDNHFHVHGPMKNKALMQDFVVHILKETKIAYSVEAGQGPAEQVPKIEERS
jgi:hypothetical protein